VSSPSLRVRLLLGAAGASFTALAVSWFAMTLLFQRHIERRVADELRRDALQLIANLVLDPDDRPLTGRTPSDSRFVEPGGGLYWQLSTPKGARSSPSLGSERLPASPGTLGSSWREHVVDGPFGQRLFMIERVITLDDAGPPVLVQLAHDTSAVDRATDQFGREIALWLVLLWAILAAAAWVQVQLGLKPFERVRKELDRLRHNPGERLGAGHPPEIEPLTAAINALADAREKDLMAARNRAADLAHALKTPLAALSAQSRRAREAGATEAADGLDRAIAAASSTVESELARARAATVRQSAARAEAKALPVIERVIGVVERAHFGAERVFEVDVPDALTLPLDQSDLAELMGALIENAARFARRRVRVSASAPPTLQLTVEDDGPGLDSVRAEEALARGGRLDETGPGHGFGLAIVRELVEATDGTLSMDTAELGGLRVTLGWRSPK
jgi:signal transduction histidine kinase